MSEISRVQLFGKLNPVLYKAIEGATVFCKLRGNPYVELVHWLHQILQLQDSDLHRIIRHFDLDAAVLARDVTEALDRLPRGATAISDLSEHIDTAVERGWVYGTLLFGENQVRSGHLLVGMLKTASLRNALLSVSRQFERIKVEALCDNFARITSGSSEAGLAASDGFGAGAPGETSGAMAPAQMGKQEALKRFTVDLTEKARQRQDRSDRRPRRGDPADHRHPDAPAAEQPDPHRRGRRRQDGGRRGLCGPPGPRRRPAAAEGRVAADAGRRSAAGRRQHEGRVRAAPASGHRRGAGRARSRSSCSSTRPTR